MRLCLNDDMNNYSTCPLNFEIDLELENLLINYGHSQLEKGKVDSEHNKSESYKPKSILQVLEKKSLGEPISTQN